TAMRDIFEAALARDPDDRATHAAYADWLIEQGDPRGEYIHLKLALEDARRPLPEQQQLRQQAFALLREHEREWLGDLADHLIRPRRRGDPTQANIEYTFGRVCLERLAVFVLRTPLAGARPRSPAVRLLRQLKVAGVAPDDPGALRVLATARHLGNVRDFRLGDFDNHVPTPAGA